MRGKKTRWNIVLGAREHSGEEKFITRHEHEKADRSCE